MTDGSEKTHKYGINIRKYCIDHEAYVQECLSSQGNLSGLLDAHMRKLRWIQHERLAHLLVTLFFAILFLFSVWLCVALGNPLVFTCSPSFLFYSARTSAIIFS